MVLLQPRLNLKLSQKQILTPGLVQMVSVLALNKLELKDMINAEMVENPVLDEYLETVPTLDEVGGREEQRERESSATEEQKEQKKNDEKDPFDEIDFGSFFQEYLDPGYRSFADLETIETTFLRKLSFQAHQPDRPPALAVGCRAPEGQRRRSGCRRVSDRQPGRRWLSAGYRG
jgi:DNA-directed RNA polymerase specialized sigma54-like protein